MLLAQDPKAGTALVETPLGRMTLETPLALPRGAALVLTVQAQLPLMRMQLLTVDGRPAAAALAHAQVQSGGPPAAPGTPSAAGGGTGPATAGASTGPGGVPYVSLSAGTTVSATLLRPAQGQIPQGQVHPEGHAPAAWPTLGDARTAMTAARGRFESLLESAFGRSGGSSPSSGQAAGAAQPEQQGRTGEAASTASQARTIALPAGTQVTVKLVTLAAPAQVPPGGGQAVPQAVPSPAGGAPILAQGQMLAGTVSGTTATGQPIVQTPAGPLALNSRVPVPLGTTVTLEVQGNPVPAATSEGLPSSGGALAPARDWPALTEAVQLLREADPRIAQQMLQTALPRPDGQLAAGMLFFVAALKGGDLKGWLGEAGVRALERLRPALAGRLKEDFAQKGKQSEEPSSDGWKTMVIPLQNGPGLEQMTLMTRHHPEEEGGPDKDGGGTRFVVDLNLSRTGRLQLDGLMFKKSKRFDIIVRTDDPLEPAVRDGIRGIFRDAVEATGLQGGVTFQSRPPHFVDPAGASGPTGQGLVV
jgi:hypothetical protein